MNAGEVDVWELYDRVRGRLDDLYWAMERACIDRGELTKTEEAENLKKNAVRRLKEILRILDSSIQLGGEQSSRSIEPRARLLFCTSYMLSETNRELSNLPR